MQAWKQNVLHLFSSMTGSDVGEIVVRENTEDDAVLIFYLVFPGKSPSVVNYRIEYRQNDNNPKEIMFRTEAWYPVLHNPIPNYGSVHYVGALNFKGIPVPMLFPAFLDETHRRAHGFSVEETSQIKSYVEACVRDGLLSEPDLAEALREISRELWGR